MTANQDSDTRSGFLLALTALRFFFALGVVIFHLKFFLPTYFPGNVFADKLSVGVEFFFVLSGFVLHYNYRSRAKLHLREFYVRRFARIYPLHLVTLTFWCACFLATWEVPARVALWSGLANLTLTQAFIPGLAFSLGYNAVSWSLSDEMFFYSVFPVVRRRWVSIAVIAAVLTYLAIAHACGKQGAINAAFPMLNYFFPPVRIADFAVGILAAHFFTTERALPGATMLEIAILVVLTAQLHFLELPPDLAPLGFIFTAPLFLWIFAHQQGAISRFLARSRLLVLLGEASFSLYMWHVMLLVLIGRSLPKDLPRWPTLAVVLAVLVAVSAASYRFIERPLRRRVSDGLLPRAPAAPTIDA